MFRTPLLIASCLAAASASAYDAGDFVIRGGLASVDPAESSSAIAVNRPSAAAGDKTGTEVGVDGDISLGISFTYFIRPQIAIELLGATPFKHSIQGAGILSGLGKLGEVQHLPPTLSVQYYPMPSEAKLQPYVGAGLNYTIFFKEDTTQTLTNSVGALASLPNNPVAGVQATSTDLELEDSIGLAAQAGLDYRLTERIGLNAAVWYVDIDTKADITAETNAGRVRADVDVDIDPWVYMVGVAIKL
ncbi:OmpW/AlkL family protein [Allohahella marinimesophila]|uniref:Outer membrane beta-barrel protein n=1 Tax=Allohahella marinimesophila TaxID=1054972 RepID=A0ABP7PX33_9GAMM